MGHWETLRKGVPEVIVCARPIHEKIAFSWKVIFEKTIVKMLDSANECQSKIESGKLSNRPEFNLKVDAQSMPAKKTG